MAISRHIPPRQLLSLLLACAVAVVLSFPTHIDLLDNLAERAELDSFDSRMKFANWLQQSQTADSIQLVALTTQDYLELREDLDQRMVYIYLLEYLAQMEVAAVIIDVFFDGPRSSDELFALNMGLPEDENYLPVFLPFVFDSALSTHPHAHLMADQEADAEKARLDELSDEELREQLMTLIDEHYDLEEQWNQAFSENNQPLEEQLKNELKPLNLYRRWLASLEFVRRRMAIQEVTETTEQLPLASFLSLPADPLMLNATGLGFANIVPDPEDGVLRRAPLLYQYEGYLYPHLDLVYLCHYYGVLPSDLNVAPGDSISFLPKQNGESRVVIPINEGGGVMIYYAEGESLINRSYKLGELKELADSYQPGNPEAMAEYERRCAALVENGLADPRELKDKLVIIGENRPAAADLSPIPLAASYSRFAIHAQLIDMVLKGRYLRPAPRWICRLINLLLALLVLLIVNRMSYMRMALALTLLLACLHLAAFSLFSYWNVVIDVVRPVLVIVLGSIILMLYRIGFTDREDRRIRNFFNRMVSPEVVRELLESPNRASLAGAKRTVTLLFVDIRGFTALLEEHAADSILDVLNEYYDRVAQAIVDNHGHVNKFIGDAVFGMFGAPQPVENAEWRAIRAAIQIKRSMVELNASERLQSLGFALHTGIGINTGEVVVGMVGGEQTKRDYTALGDSVNVAQRLEHSARYGEIMIGESTFQAVRKLGPEEVDEVHLRFRKREELALKGKRETITAYEVLFNVADSIEEAEEEAAEL